MYKFIFVRIINKMTFSGYLFLKGHKSVHYKITLSPHFARTFNWSNGDILLLLLTELDKKMSSASYRKTNNKN